MNRSVKLPRWAAACDVIAVATGLLTLSVLVFGGFRLATIAGRLSVTDWRRPALIAALLLIVRHAFVREMPLPQHVGALVVAWWRRPETRLLLPIHLATRLGVLAVGFLAVILVGFPPEAANRWSIYRNALFDLPARWDAGWYLSVALDGYRWDPAARPDLQQNIAFFPAFPMLVRFLSPIFGRQPLWVGLGISLVAFYLALGYLLRLARLDIQDEDRAAAGVTLIAVYPFAVYFSAAYTEALFLLAMAAAIYHFRAEQWWRSAAWGALAGLTRPNGFLLSVVLGLLAVRPLWNAGARRATLPPPDGWRPLAVRLATASAPGLGMLAFSLFIYDLTGHPFRWAAQTVAWGRVYRGLTTVVTDRAAYIAANGFYGYVSTQTIDLVYGLAVLFVLGAVWPVYRRFGLAYAALLVTNTLPPMAAGGMMSMGRVTSVLFPAFFWMASAVPPRHRTAWVALFATLQGFAAVMFFTWRPLF